jgi:DMSO reductase family type II enzyme heme b subunit
VVRVKRYTGDSSQFRDPTASLWRTVPQEALPLDPAPLLAQPSPFVQASWRDRPYGLVDRLLVQAVYSDSEISFRLQWEDPAADAAIDDTDAFGDAAAVLFPLKSDAPLTSMGSPQEPVVIWYWRPDIERPYLVRAEGIGTSSRQTAAVEAAGRHDGAGWAVVLSRGLDQGAADGVVFAPGRRGKAAFAVWQGANAERAGIKAATLQWQPLEIEA